MKNAFVPNISDAGEKDNMSNKITKGEITYLAKRICKINEALHDACMLAQELCHNEVLHQILLEKDEATLTKLRERVQKYADTESPADMTGNEYYLEEVTKILSTVFYEN